jgi:hypothetical protein
MKISYLIVIAIVLAVFAVGVAGASEDVDALANCSGDTVAIEESEAALEIDEDSVDVNLHKDEPVNLNNNSVVAEITAPHNATGQVRVFVNHNDTPSFRGNLTELSYCTDENDSDFYVYRISLANLTYAFEKSTYFINVSYDGDGYYRPQCDAGNVTFDDLRKDAKYEFFLDVTDNYVIGMENILMVSLPFFSNECILTMDTNDNVVYNFHHGGLGWLINIGNWNLTTGKHTLNLTYPGDDEYRPFSKTINFTCSFISVYIGEEMVYPRFSFAFAMDATGKVQIYVDGKGYKNKTVAEFRQEAESGYPRYEPLYTYFMYLDNLDYGNHTYKILYTDDDKYSLERPIEGQFNVTYFFDVVETDTNGIHYTGDTVNFGLWMPDDVIKVLVQYNGKEIEVIPTFADYYDAVLSISDLKAGDNNITFTCLMDGVPSKSIVMTVHMIPINGSQNEANSTVSKNDAKITSGDLKAIYSDGSNYKVTVYGNDGRPAKTKVTFLINGKVYKTVTSNAMGVASVKITQKPGNYKITAKALGKSVTRKLTVKHILKVEKPKVKKSAKKVVIKASLSKVNGKYLKGKRITLKFAAKKLTSKTNKKGVAKFTIKKSKKSKKIKCHVAYLKDIVKFTVKV